MLTYFCNYNPRRLSNLGRCQKLFIISHFMALILPQTKFETIPPKTVGGIAFLTQADTSCLILGFSTIVFSPSSNCSDYETFEIPEKRPFDTVYFYPPLIYCSHFQTKSTKTCHKTQTMTVRPPPP